MKSYSRIRQIKNHIASALHQGKNSQARHTFSANIVQQFCSALIILYLPNILGKDDYAQVVYVTVLLSFFAFADAGMSMAYGRVVPALLVQNKHDEVSLWNSTTLTFGKIASVVYSVLIGFLYYVRYGHLLNTLLLLPVPFVVFWFSFYLTRANVHNDFRLYGRVNSARAIASLVVFPLAFFWGLTGWFTATLVAAILALANLGKQLFKPLGRPHWALIRKHLGEGLILSSTSVLRIQLLYFARFYASMCYNAGDIATYGIISGGYQSLSAMVLSIFMPVFVSVQRHYGESEEKAIIFSNTIVARSLLPIAAVTILSIAVAPPLFGVCFPRYHFDSVLLTIMLLSIVFYPFIVVYGALMIAYKRFGQFLIAVVGCLGVSWLFSALLDVHHYTYGAAWGQLFGLIIYTLLLFFMLSGIADRKEKKLLKQQVPYLASALAFSAAVISAFVFI